MRTGRARLIETLQQLLITQDHPEEEYYIGLDWHRAIEPYREVSEEYADLIMDDINLGIIAAEVDG